MSAQSAVVIPAARVIEFEPRQMKIERQALDVRAAAAAIVIRDQPTYDGAIARLRAIKDLRAEAEAEIRPTIDAAHQAHKAALALLQRVDDPLKDAERTIKGKVSAWDMKQERIRLEAERKVREEAERLAAEALELELAAMEAQGASAVEVAAAIQEAEYAPVAAPVMAAPTYAKAAGVSTRVTYKAEVSNLRQLISYVATRPEFECFLQVNQVALNQAARMQGAALRIPGVRVIEERGVAVRR